MSQPTNNSGCSLCTRLGLKPFTKRNVFFYYIPIHSMVSYAALSVNVMNPALAVRLVPKRDCTNFLLFHTLIGTTLYLYSRRHLEDAPTKKRVAYSVVGSTLFGLGSVLLWAMIRSGVPRNSTLATILGIISGVGIARISYDYIEHIDSKVPAIKPAQ